MKYYFCFQDVGLHHLVTIPLSTYPPRPVQAYRRQHPKSGVNRHTVLPRCHRHPPKSPMIIHPLAILNICRDHRRQYIQNYRRPMLVWSGLRSGGMNYRRMGLITTTAGGVSIRMRCRLAQMSSVGAPIHQKYMQYKNQVDFFIFSL